MPVRRLPDNPNLDRLRKYAKELLRGARAGDPEATALVAELHPSKPADLALSDAQLVLARMFGFPSWPKLHAHVENVNKYTRSPHTQPIGGEAGPDDFLRLACLNYGNDDAARHEDARRMLAEHPELSSASIHTAAAVGDVAAAEQLLDADPALVEHEGGPFRWVPLLYAAYSRLDSTAPGHSTLEVARLLLDRGADPNAGYLWDGLPSPFTALTGVFGHGEQGPRNQPAHPRWRELARLLLDAGADPNDAQTLYNRIFQPDDSHLEMLFEYGLGTGDGGPWHRRIPDLDSPERMLRVQLRWAIEHNQPARVRLLVEHGVDVRSPFEGDGPAWSPGDGRTPVELALLNGNSDIADHLVAHGAEPPAPDPVRDLIAAAFRADRSAVAAARPEVVAQARRSRPGLIVWAASRASVETVTLLAELGFDVNAYGRGDAPVEQPWETALHQAAGNGDVEMTRALLALGADPTLRDRRFDGTPFDWAVHLGQPATAEVLGRPGGQ